MAAKNISENHAHMGQTGVIWYLIISMCQEQNKSFWYLSTTNSCKNLSLANNSVWFLSTTNLCKISWTESIKPEPRNQLKSKLQKSFKLQLQQNYPDTSKSHACKFHESRRRSPSSSKIMTQWITLILNTYLRICVEKTQTRVQQAVYSTDQFLKSL